MGKCYFPTNEVVVSITIVHRKENAMKTHQKVTVGGIVLAVAIDVGRELAIDEAESLILKAIRALIEWIKNLFSPPQQPGWYC